MNNSSTISSIITPVIPNTPSIDIDLDRYASIIAPPLWGILVVIGAIGNGLVIFTLAKHGEKTPTNCYIINLGVADLAFILIVLPCTTVMFALSSWELGDAMCKTFNYMIYVSLHATCLTLTAMTIDRYFAIVHPVESMNWRTTRVSTFVSVCVWQASFLLSIPFAMYQSAVHIDEGSNIIYCKGNWPGEDWEKWFNFYVIMTTFVIPVSLIVGCYARILLHVWNGRRLKQKTEDEASVPPSQRSSSHKRRKKKVTTMVIVVVVLFIACWLPIQLFNLVHSFHRLALSNWWFFFKMFAHTLSYANSCVNPFIYAFLNDSFKKSFRKTFPMFNRLSIIRTSHRNNNRRNSETRNRDFETRCIAEESQTMQSTTA